jgi:hypothetical protein
MADASTYTGDPAGRPIDAVRLELGKEISLHHLTDGEITYNLSRANQNALLAASFCAETIAGIYADRVDKSMGGASVSLSQKAESWRKKAAALLARASSPTITPRASSSASRALKFGIGQHDNPATGSGYSITGYL